MTLNPTLTITTCNAHIYLTVVFATIRQKSTMTITLLMQLPRKTFRHFHTFPLFISFTLHFHLLAQTYTQLNMQEAHRGRLNMHV